MAVGFAMKRVLIISPHYPPVNAADMHRVRQSLPYFEQLGWQPVVITVDESFIESYSLDNLLELTIPPEIIVHKVKALPLKNTRKFGLGSLSMRSYFSIKKKGSELLAVGHFDLVYFSTTAFHVMALGPYWKRKFKVPFIVDIQDPWRNDFYLDKPSSERPPKFLFAYNIDKYLEAKTIPYADGIISVSQGYCDVFKKRYPSVNVDSCRVISFGIADTDIEVMKKYVVKCDKVSLHADKTNIVYIGRGGHDMAFALNIIFKVIQKGLVVNKDVFSKLHFWFIGTSYAPAGKGEKTIMPIALSHGVQQFVTEITDRLPYFEALFVLNKADILLIPGSTDTSYTASKIYPYIILQKKMLAVFNYQSSIINLLNRLQYGEIISFDHTTKTVEEYIDECFSKLSKILSTDYSKKLNEVLFVPCKALSKTKEQVDFFNEVLNKTANSL